MTKKHSAQGSAVRRVPSQPWPWILLALNPLLITGGVFHPDPYIKIIFVAAVLGLTLLFWPWRADDTERLRFSVPELCWLAYLGWGGLAILWSAAPVIAFERWMYLLIPTAGYAVARQTTFWRSALFWHVFAGVALVVGLIGICMYLFAGTPLGFDWINSAGRPSSTLSYRAYAGTYLALSLPFLAWLAVSRFARTPLHTVFFTASLTACTVFLVYTRARSGWLGALAALAVMAFAVLMRRRTAEMRRPLALAAAVVVALALFFVPPSAELLQGDIQPQKLEGTGKETFAGTVAGTFQLIASGGSDRFGLWQMAADIAFQPTVRGTYEGPFGTPRWVFGAGLGQYPVLTAEHGYISYILGAEVHNDWLQALVALGPIGLLALIGLAGSTAWYAWRARSGGVVIAALGGLAAWVFSTQTDFIEMRVYAVLWVAAVIAIVHGEAAVPRPVQVRIGGEWRAVGRRVWGAALLWIAVSFGITMNVDARLFSALTERNRPLDEVVQESVSSYDNGMGKYLLYTGFSELSRVLASMPATDPLLYALQDSVSQALLAMHPNDMAALVRLRETYARQNDHRRLLAINDRYLHLRPQDAESWRLRGEAFALLGDTVAGLEALAKAEALAPDDANTLRKLIEIQEHRGERAAALAHMEHYLALYPDDITVRLFKSQTELMSGDSATAARTAYEALQRDTASAAARQFWAQRIGARYRQMVSAGR